jgi:hypothetical protein
MSGVGHFQKTVNRSDEGDVYDVARALERMNAFAGGAAGVAQSEVEGVVNGTSALQRSLSGARSIVAVHMLRDALAMVRVQCHGPIDISLAIHARESRFVRVHIPSSGNNIGATFLRRIHTAMEETGMNKFAVIAAMAECFASWSTQDRRGHRGSNLFLMQLSAT